MHNQLLVERLEQFNNGIYVKFIFSHGVVIDTFVSLLKMAHNPSICDCINPTQNLGMGTYAPISQRSVELL